MELPAYDEAHDSVIGEDELSYMFAALWAEELRPRTTLFGREGFLIDLSQMCWGLLSPRYRV